MGEQMPTIPTSVDDITAAWLSELLGHDITSVATEQIGQGIGVSSAVYRVTCEGDGCPSSVVVKLKALDDAAVFTSTMLRMYVREVRFFDELATASPIRVPKGFGGRHNDDGSDYVLVMEDMGAMRIVDQNVGMSIQDAERCVDELAQWHATWWACADRFTESGAVVSLADPIYPAVLPLVFAEGWEILQAKISDIPDSIRTIAPRWVDALPGLLERLSSSPTTLIHGDYRADNILFDSDGSVVLLDFQLTGVGSGSYDLAYFITQSIEPDVAAANERRLFDAYVSGLVTAGVPVGDTEALWEMYRVAAAFCLVYPVVACRGMDFDDPRQRLLVTQMFSRFDRAAKDLKLDEIV